MDQTIIQRQASPNRNPKRQQTHQQSSECSGQKFHSGAIIAGKFKLIEKVGQGSFGMIYKTEHIETGEIFATKFEKREDNQSGISLLVREIKVLVEVKTLEGFPEIAFYGRDEEYNYFIETYLGQNLEQILKRCNSRFSISTVLKIAIKLIDRLKVLHSKSFIHRDLKPDNIVIGYFDFDQIYLIDFGLSKYYRDSKGNHIPPCEKKGIIGTARYASMSAHQGKEQSRKDDIESLGYVLVYLAKGTLPWVNLQTATKSEKYQKIKEMKSQITLEKLCEGLPKCFLNLFIYARGLDFVGEPDYGFLREQFQKCLQHEPPNQEFEWERFPELKKRKSRFQALKLKLEQEKAVEPRKKEQDDQRNSQRKSTEEVQDSRKNSFLNVPMVLGDNEVPSPDPKKSRNFSQNISTLGTSQVNHYQLSQINQGPKENNKHAGAERKQGRNFSINHIANQRKETSPTPKVFIKQATTKTERKMAFNEIEDDYRDYDNIDLIANEETNLSFQSITPMLVHKKSVLSLEQLN